MTGSALLAGYGADLALGDPARLHPVAGFGSLAVAAERAIYAPTRGRGALVTAALVGACAAAAELLARRTSRGAVLAATGWIALGGRSLRREAATVAYLLEHDELDLARDRLRSLCGRDASELDAAGLYRAAVESLAENTGDAVVGALLWGALRAPRAWRATGPPTRSTPCSAIAMSATGSSGGPRRDSTTR